MPKQFAEKRMEDLQACELLTSQCELLGWSQSSPGKHLLDHPTAARF